MDTDTNDTLVTNRTIKEPKFHIEIRECVSGDMVSRDGVPSRKGS